MSLGTKNIAQKTGNIVTLAAGNEIKWLPIGVAIDWGSVSGAGAATTLSDGTPIAAGDKYLRYGTVMVPVSVKTVQTLTVSGSPTGGKTTATYTILGKDYVIEIPYNATIGEVKSAFDAVFDGGYDVVAVSGSAGSYTLTFDERAQNVAAPSLEDDYTGGTTPAAVAAVTTAGSNSNRKWKKWNESDTLVRDRVGILNETIVMRDANLMNGYTDTDLTGLIRGGIIWGERLNIASNKIATLQDAMPELRLAPAQ